MEEKGKQSCSPSYSTGAFIISTESFLFLLFVYQSGKKLLMQDPKTLCEALIYATTSSRKILPSKPVCSLNACSAVKNLACCLLGVGKVRLYLFSYKIHLIGDFSMASQTVEKLPLSKALPHMML